MTNASSLASMQTVVVGDIHAEIVALEEELRSAQLNADVDTLAKLISDDLLFAGPDGRLATKEQDLTTYKSGLVRFIEHEPQELRIRSIGQNAAVTSLRARLVVNVGGAESSGVYRYTRVWGREANKPWQIVAGHVSEISGENEID